MRSIIKYIGRKNLDLGIVLKKHPNIKTYCEPFSGSFYTGFITAEKFPKIEYIYNDYNEDIYNFWKCAQNNIFDVIDKVNEIKEELEKYSELDDRSHIIYCKKQLNDAVTNAAITYIMQNSQSFKKEIEDNIESSEVDVNTLLTYIKMLENIKIFNESYEKIIEQFDSPDTLFMIDPPYYVKRVDYYYKSDCRYFYHREAAEIFKRIKGKFILTYNISDYIKSLYSEFDQTEICKSYYTKDLVIRNFDMTDKEVSKMYKLVDLGDIR